MKSRIRFIFLSFVSFILILDAIAFAGLLQDFPALRGPGTVVAYWVVPFALIAMLVLIGRKMITGKRADLPPGFFVVTGFFLAFYLPKLFYVDFLQIEILLKLASAPVYLQLSRSGTFSEFVLDGPLNFISLMILPVSVFSFFIIVGGILFGRFHFRVRRIEIASPEVPAGFDGFRLAQISDLHLGSLQGHEGKIRKAVELINRESPDLIVFTGDLVNNVAEEAEGWTGLLSELSARYGKFSILGNHDYGEYFDWKDGESRMENMKRLYRVHRESGFNLLMNRSERIVSGSDQIYVAGVENWGLPPFKQHGKLEKALENIPEGAFTVLLSHDPSHWDAEILNDSRVQLTLSGHTHGMQFGIRTRRFRWSPIQLRYPRWIGLYRQENRYLYVNPGLGYIGYAGRIGIRPEITILSLRRTPVETVPPS
jgi:predicted MPP superfamily phosphohydrolase